jgi:hypothetical protein
VGVEGGGVSEWADLDGFELGGRDECEVASSRGGAGAVDNRGWLAIPPVVQAIRQSTTRVEQRVGVCLAAEVESAGVDAVIDPESVEVGLVGEVERWGSALESYQPQVPVGLGDDPAGEPFPGGDGRPGSGVTDTEPA